MVTGTFDYLRTASIILCDVNPWTWFSTFSQILTFRNRLSTGLILNLRSVMHVRSHSDSGVRPECSYSQRAAMIFLKTTPIVALSGFFLNNLMAESLYIATWWYESVWVVVSYMVVMANHTPRPSVMNTLPLGSLFKKRSRAFRNWCLLLVGIFRSKILEIYPSSILEALKVCCCCCHNIFY